MKEFDFSSISVGNLKSYLYSVSKATDMFTISLNGEEFDLPIEIATCYSNKILENLTLDPTIRRLDFQIKFSNPSITQKIINAITDQNQTKTKIEYENENEILDLLLFGKEIGYDNISMLLNDYFSAKIQNIDKDNALELLSFCRSFGHLENVEQKIISFISSHLYEFINESKFIEWSSDKSNFNYLESILSNENLRIKHEDDLLKFIIEISKLNQINEALFGKVYIEYCDVSAIRLFINYLDSQKPEFQDNAMKNILVCISRRLYQGKQSNNGISRFICPTITIGSNTGKEIPDKYIERISDTQYKFMYPSDDSTTCNDIFKLNVPPGDYKLECIGASGGKGISKEGGCGGYSCGVLSLNEQSDLYLYIGGKGSSNSGPNDTVVKGGFNGGGCGRTGKDKLAAGSGGGATDIRLKSNSLSDRIIVAGGGGGSAGYNADGRDSLGGDGGGLNGNNGTSNDSNEYGTGGTQSQPGISNDNVSGKSGDRNNGGDGQGNAPSGGGGGGGYFGGGGGYRSGGGGGSGFVSEKLQSKNGISKETKNYNNIGNGYVIITKL